MKDFLFFMSKRVKNNIARTIPLFLVFTLVGLIVLVVLNFNFSGNLQKVNADSGTATTTVFIANLAPSFDYVYEAIPSGNGTGVGDTAGNPTNAGTNLTFKAKATDDNGDSWYLVVCDSEGVVTSTDGSAPHCSGVTWATSTLTSSGVEALATYTTKDSDNEVNNWYAYACDNNPGGQSCSTSSQGTGATSSDAYSPFYVNHRPSFSGINQNPSADPGSNITYQSTSSDPDSSGSQDNVTLYVCSVAGFNGGADPGCSIATSTLCSSSAVASNASCSFALPVPKQDDTYDAYVYLVDNHGFVASGGAEGTNPQYTVNNVAPTVASSSIQLLDTDESGPLTLQNESTSTNGFKVKFTVTDNNSCQNSSGGTEITSAIANIYRSGVGMSNCNKPSDFDANDCYTSSTNWHVVCEASSTSCTGPDDSDEEWTCTFSLQYHADPTDLGSKYPDENWLASVSVADDNNASSGLVESEEGNELQSFLAFDLLSSTIDYGNMQPGQTQDPLHTTTTIAATGNVGVDESLSGTDMCRDYPTCTPPKIPVENQHYATSSVSFDTAIALSTSSTDFALHCPKTTTTLDPATADTWWGLRVPTSTNVAGAYTGQNTFVAVESSSTYW